MRRRGFRLALTVGSLGLALLAGLGGGGPEVRPSPPPAKARRPQVPASSPAPSVAPVQAASLALVKAPNAQPDNILSEKLNWSSRDLKVVLLISAGPTGHVVATRVKSVSPPGDRLAIEVGEFLEQRFRQARFRPRKDASYPYTFEFVVNLPAARDAAGDRRQ